MSSIVTEQGILHYESIGRGQPIILLHGWINSWDVWRDVMISLASTRRYRVYALDFWGFGDSAKASKTQITSYQISGFVEMVHQFMDSIGIQKAPIFGHFLGGTVALQFSITYPERVERVIIVGSPVVGSSLNAFLQLSGYGFIARLLWRYPILQSALMRILMARNSPKVRSMIFRDAQPKTMEPFFRSISAFHDMDLRNELPNLSIPTLGIYGIDDNVVSPANARIIKEKIQNSQVVMMEHSRNFPMIDQPEMFLKETKDFLQIA